MNSMLFSVSVLCVVILLLTVVLKRFGQPYLVAYMLTGCVLGPHMMALFPGSEDIAFTHL